MTDVTQGKDFLKMSRQKEGPRREYKWIGKSMKRVEDPRILTGQGQYIDDIQLPNMAHAATLRSPHAHARIRSIDTAKAKAHAVSIMQMTQESGAQRSVKRERPAPRSRK